MLGTNCPESCQVLASVSRVRFQVGLGFPGVFMSLASTNVNDALETNQLCDFAFLGARLGVSLLDILQHYSTDSIDGLVYAYSASTKCLVYCRGSSSSSSQ